MRGFNALTNAMRQHAMLADNDKSQPRIGTISSYDQSTHAVKVMIQPEGVESNWMPLGAIGIGNGWGVLVGPQLGDQVAVVFEHGDFESGAVVARIFSTAQAAPAVPPGEIWAVHQSGSSLKLIASGDVDINSVANFNITTAANCSIAVSGDADVTVTGNASYTAAMHHFVGPVLMDNSLTVTQLTAMNGGTG